MDSLLWSMSTQSIPQQLLRWTIHRVTSLVERRNRLRATLLLLLLFVTRAAPAADVEWLTGAPFDRALQAPVSLFREEAELRDVLDQLAVSQQTACRLDRRIDPSQTVSISLTQTPLRRVFTDIAAQADAVSGRLGETLIIGRADQLDRLLTEAASRQELLRTEREIPASRRLQLASARQIQWRDLDRPLDVLQQIAQGWGFRIVNPELLPHDLWAGGTVVGVDSVEALTLVLGQFELSFEWREAGDAIEIIPAAASPVVARTHRPRGMSQTTALARLKQDWPDLSIQRQRSALEVTATVLQHEAIARLLGEVAEDDATAHTAPTPLSRRRFPRVRIVRKPLGAVLEAFRQQGIDVIYDPATLRQGGVDLEALISLELEDATADDLFTALCKPVGMRYTIDGARVTLRPAGADQE